MNFTIEIEQEEDGRFLAEVIHFPGVLAYGQTREEAIVRVEVLALCFGGNEPQSRRERRGIRGECLSCVRRYV
ncbi:MAG: type II toxin-antitoxin system HicB family antitoxin [Hassallia sp.]